MSTSITLAGLAFAALTSAFAFLILAGPAAADPICQFGFQTEQKQSWILKCKKTVPLVYKGVALTEANNANCKTSAYWNFGPKVTAQHLAGNQLVLVRYTCGHVEG